MIFHLIRAFYLLLLVWFSDCVFLLLSGFDGQEFIRAVSGLVLVTMGLFCFSCLGLVVRGE